MSLEEQIKKEEEELAKLEAAEAGEGDSDKEEDTPEDDADQADDTDSQDSEKEAEDADKNDEAAKEEGDADKDDEADKGEDVKDENPNDVAAKLRIERRERLRLQEEIAELRRAQTQRPAETRQEEATQRPQETVEERLARIENERYTETLNRQAAEELSTIEKDFMKTTPDYEPASKHMITSMYNGVKAAYPQLNDQQAVQFVQKRVLEIASRAAQNGQNPAEVFYQMSYDNYGYKPAPAEAAKPKANPADKLKTVARNKKRSATGLSGGGQNANSNVTLQEADNMDLASFGSMSESEIDALIAQADS